MLKTTEMDGFYVFFRRDFTAKIFYLAISKLGSIHSKALERSIKTAPVQRPLSTLT